MRTLSPNDPRPTYVQIADDLRAAITSGELAPGAKLPAVRVLTEEYGVAGMTVQHAISVLRDEGRLTSAQGRGVFVTTPDQHTNVGPAASDRTERRLDDMAREVHELRSRVERLEDAN